MAHNITTIPVKQFANLFREIDEKNHDTRFCFILGAGASRGSGIKTGGEMAKEWFADIESHRIFKEKDVQEWMTRVSIDRNRLAEFYGQIYQKRFSLKPDMGYDYLINEMHGKEPSFGYSVLSQLLTGPRHKVVITTNFDSLVESALYSYSNVRPVVVGHEALADFARPRAKVPLIAKIHRDLLYHPLNDKEETGEMASPWTSVLEHIFKTHVPIVIGYGGNDGSLMKYLLEIDPCNGMYWCLFGKEEPREDIRKVVERHCGHFVEMDGFDEMMFDIMESMGYKLVGDTFSKTAKRRELDYQEQVKAILEKKKQSDDPADQKAAAQLSERAPKDDWWSWQLKVYGAEDDDEKDRLYREGIEKTKHPSLIGNYAIFLKNVRKDFDKAERHYLKALEAEPDDADFNGNYANFLNDVRKDFDKAERHYLKALEAEPDHANNNGNYANFLRNVRKDFDKAERHYLKALKANPDHANNNGNYAQMLLAAGRMKEGTVHLEKAFEHCDDDTLALELWLYRYAHLEEHREHAQKEIEQLLSKGARSAGWDFSANIERAITDGHPNPEELKRLAAAISEE